VTYAIVILSAIAGLSLFAAAGLGLLMYLTTFSAGEHTDYWSFLRLMIPLGAVGVVTGGMAAALAWRMAE
jgi:hypothetical protein